MPCSMNDPEAEGVYLDADQGFVPFGEASNLTFNVQVQENEQTEDTEKNKFQIVLNKYLQ